MSQLTEQEGVAQARRAQGHCLDPRLRGDDDFGLHIPPRHSRAGGNPAAFALRHPQRNNSTFQIH
jgi:hypothetical protein